MRFSWLLVLVGCASPCEPVPSLEGMTASVDLGEAPAYLDRGELLAAMDEALGHYGVVRVADERGDIRIVWRAGITTAGEAALGLELDDTVWLNAAEPWTLDACANRVWGYDVETILSHELGHVAGLPHTAEGIMKPHFRQCEIVTVCNAE